MTSSTDSAALILPRVTGEGLRAVPEGESLQWSDSRGEGLESYARKDHAEHGGGGGPTLGHHPHHAADVLSSRILTLASDLAAPRDAIDGAFVSVGSRLAECAEGAAGVGHKSET